MVLGYDPNAVQTVSGGTRVRTKTQVFDELIAGLAKEINLMLEEGVV
jgi:hypothetical protein